MLNRSAVQPFLNWLHRADPTSGGITLDEVGREPTIYLIPECDTKDDVHEVLEELCEEIFVQQLDNWFRDKTTWPRDRSYGVFCRWLDVQYLSMLIDLCDEPLVNDFESILFVSHSARSRCPTLCRSPSIDSEKPGAREEILSVTIEFW